MVYFTTKGDGVQYRISHTFHGIAYIVDAMVSFGILYELL
jgi:hypothetical protein